MAQSLARPARRHHRRLIGALAEPPSYRTPSAWPGHTRHYLPDLGHKKGETGSTDLTLDPFLSIEQGGELLIRRNADLGSEQWAVMAKVAELMPYLGRAGSVCEAGCWMRTQTVRPLPRPGGCRRR
ncbi:MAG TPA: hypothetical protein DHU96_18300 [Actinobacteria bacterium]|nr:hypothetical protein [Actinomycetota bacterium]